MYLGVVRDARRGGWIPGTGVTGGCKLPWLNSGNQTQVL